MLLYCSLFALLPESTRELLYDLGLPKIMKINLTFYHGLAAEDVSIKTLQSSDL